MRSPKCGECVIADLCEYRDKNLPAAKPLAVARKPAARSPTARPPARHHHRQHRGALGLGVGRVVERRVECRVARQRVHDTQVDETREQAVDARATGRHGAVALEALEERHGGVGHREQT